MQRHYCSSHRRGVIDQRVIEVEHDNHDEKPVWLFRTVRCQREDYSRPTILSAERVDEVIPPGSQGSSAASRCRPSLSKILVPQQLNFARERGVRLAIDGAQVAADCSVEP